MMIQTATVYCMPNVPWSTICLFVPKTNLSHLDFIFPKEETLRATESTESKQKAAGGLLLLYRSISPFTLYKILFRQR